MDVHCELATVAASREDRVMLRLCAAIALAGLSVQSTAAAAQSAAVVDPQRDSKFPAHNQQLLIPSHGIGMNALLFVASGRGPHPAVILMHGLPGNERNLDLAQAIRRAGWDVLTFTYRGAWGSPGDFSIGNSMEDTAAVLAFARSVEGTKYGIDPRHIVLAGHSMGGATAAMTAAGAAGLDGLILIDPWNIGGGTSKGAVSRDELVKSFDDFGNSLHGATPETVAEDAVTNRTKWDLVQAARHFRRLPVLMLTARYGIGDRDRPVTTAMQSAGARVTAIQMDTDHSFSDHRIALSKSVVSWLQALPLRR
jgi:pimeloyl-ACP methyl ester carboxylesterase